MSSADVDECSMGYHQRVCSGNAEICRNTVGSYECHCHHGYTRDHDANRCYGTTYSCKLTYFTSEGLMPKNIGERQIKR